MLKRCAYTASAISDQTFSCTELDLEMLASARVTSLALQARKSSIIVCARSGLDKEKSFNTEDFAHFVCILMMGYHPRKLFTVK